MCIREPALWGSRQHPHRADREHAVPLPEQSFYLSINGVRPGVRNNLVARPIMLRLAQSAALHAFNALGLTVVLALPRLRLAPPEAGCGDVCAPLAACLARQFRRQDGPGSGRRQRTTDRAESQDESGSDDTDEPHMDLDEYVGTFVDTKRVPHSGCCQPTLPISRQWAAETQEEPSASRFGGKGERP